MNTTSLILNGRTAASIAFLLETPKATVTALSSRSLSCPPIAVLSGPSTPQRPQHSRRPSSKSPGWYNTEGGMTLDDFAKRLDTNLARFEQWQGKCMQNIAMALMRPTPIVLFVFNPINLFVLVAVAIWWLAATILEAGAQG